MKSFFSEIFGGVLIMIVASLVGITVNSVRTGGVPLIQKGAPVSTVQHGVEPDTALTESQTLGSVSLQEMKRLYDEGLVFIIDARDPQEYEFGHIPGAINVPYDRLPEYLDMLSAEVPMDQPVIIYCRGPECDFSDQLATELKVLGYQNVRVFTGGWEQWSAAGYPVEGLVPK
ncbi:MAG TPA: rhodanese-like domain-containing protein [Candidatus Krumholzibacteria bacterium]|nr:rhodanese-like domain-containing protein [Candidatus Krumholzibacteria bacterium]